MTCDEYYNLCGGCQAWGADPFIKDGKCEICDRRPEIIGHEHGRVRLSTEDKHFIEETNEKKGNCT